MSHCLFFVQSLLLSHPRRSLSHHCSNDDCAHRHMYIRYEVVANTIMWRPGRSEAGLLPSDHHVQ